MQLSLIIISHRPELLRRCLASLEASGCAEAEVLVALNGLGADAPALARELAARWPRATVLDLPRSSRGAARNLAVARSGGEILYFLDDDVVVPPGFCAKVLRTFARHPEVGYAGGPNLGTPEATDFQLAADAVLSSAWGAGPMRVRYAAGGAERLMSSWGFMLCNLGVRREVFFADGLAFPESCVSAEENLLLYRAERRRGLGLFSPELHVYHVRRSGLAGFCHQAFQSGAGRMQITRMAPGSLQPVTVLPPAGLAYLVFLALGPRTTACWAAPALYACVCCAEALRLLWRTRRPAAAAWLPLLMLCGHLSYALGMVFGLRLPLTRT
ncbi:MAG: glycosyltransferase [Elusimicrobia bacterium]|nr:glycosyltransferase [Elusimicrobiota bacterium]